MNELLTPREVYTARDYIRNQLLYPDTGLLYDRPVNRLHHFPTPLECKNSDPNPCGYGGGMEDCMISGATMLEACLLQQEKEKSENPMAHLLVEGMLRCAAQGKDGFLPRGLCPTDGKSHYMDSSRDQYTMFIYALLRYRDSKYCTPRECWQIADAIVAIARRAEANVTPENGFDLLREDGGRSLATTLWGPTLGNHEVHRLPMIYAAAFAVSGEAKWKERYQQLRSEAYVRATPMQPRYYHLYTLQQMQASLYVCRMVDTDPKWQSRYTGLMEQVANYAETQVDKVAKKLDEGHDFNMIHGDFRAFPLVEQKTNNEFGVYQNRDPGDTNSFYLLQDAPNIVIVCRMAGRAPSPEALALYRNAFERIDFATHHRATPIHFLNAHYQL